MSRAYARQSRRGREREANTPVSGPRLKPVESSADALPTIRNFVPWREMEKKLALRLAARAAAGELTGDLSEVPRPASEEEASQEQAENSGIRRSLVDQEFDDLTYSVYSLADLDARQDRAPRSAPVEIAPAPNPWSELRARRWPREWPAIKTVLTAAAVGLGAFALLTFVVLVVADLTDDLKPRKAVATASALVAAPPPVVVAPPPVVAVAEPDVILELDDIASPKPVRAHAPRSRALPAKKKGR